MLVVDTSGSMIGCTNPSSGSYQYPSSCPSSAPKNSCNMEPTRINDAKCALRQTVQAFAGEANFGLSTFSVKLSGCGNGTCVDTCTANNGSCSLTGGVGTSGEYYSGNGCSVNGFPNPVTATSCGNFPSCSSTGPGAPNYAKGTWRNGGNIVVDMLQDPTWGPSPPATNTGELLKWFDGQCDESKELFAIGGTPIAGSLRSVHQYFLSGWNTNWSASNYCASGFSVTSPTPLTTTDRACRDVNVILVTDGDESCDNQAGAVSAASALYNTGATFGGNQFNVKVHVIGFAGANKTATDAIAAAGGTTQSLQADNEAELSVALSNIISSAIKPETCDNADNNCNGCTDEGYQHYCNVKPAAQCCTWSTQAQRTTCLNNYKASITGANPNGDLTLLAVHHGHAADPAAELALLRPQRAVRQRRQQLQRHRGRGLQQVRQPRPLPADRNLQRRGRRLRRHHRQRQR